MNIGETDADGWTYVRFGDAAKAAQEGAHEVQFLMSDNCWQKHNAQMFSRDSKYRIREKARTITVTIPRPKQCEWHELPEPHIRLYYGQMRDASGACDAVRSAMKEQS